MKKTCDYSSRQRNFIQARFSPNELDNLPNGTHIVYIEPEGSDRHLSMISLDNTDGEDRSDSASTIAKKGKFKKMAQRLYPRKAIGGVKAVGGAIRHPMVTGRKVNTFVRRKNRSNLGNNGGGTIREESPQWPICEDELPQLTRSQTVTELNTMADTAGEGTNPFVTDGANHRKSAEEGDTETEEEYAIAGGRWQCNVPEI